MSFGGIYFAVPYVLLALLALPVLWFLLRAVPPAPVRRYFPGVALLLGLTDKETSTDRTPWWLVLLRMVAVAAAIFALAAPVLNRNNQVDHRSSRVLIAMDSSWASAVDWGDRTTYLEGLLAELGRKEATVAMLSLSEPSPTEFQNAQRWEQRLPGISPTAWEASDVETIEAALPDGDFNTIWLSDGLARDSRSELLELFEARGSVEVVESQKQFYGLSLSAVGSVAGIALTAKRRLVGDEQELIIQAIGPDPLGAERILSTARTHFKAGATEADVNFVLPAEVQRRVTRFRLASQQHAGAIVLTDDRFQTREVGLVEARQSREGLELLSPLHFLEKALEPSARIRSGTIDELLANQVDAIVLADVAEMTEATETSLIEWVNKGGLLLRFAGPRLAASSTGRTEEHPLMPVRLRAGGRIVGGAMSWGEPKALAPFERASPFFGLRVSDELKVAAQVVAQPDPRLADRVIARLSDGTPLVTRKSLGQGSVVLFHISANAEWSNVPLSGLFVGMLERLAVATSSRSLEESELMGTTWTAVSVLDGFGRVNDAEAQSPIDGQTLYAGQTGAAFPPGVYEGIGRKVAVNAIKSDRQLTPAAWPANVQLSSYGGEKQRELAGVLFVVALLTLVVDILATLSLSGRLRGPIATALSIAAFVFIGVNEVEAQSEESDVASVSEFVLAHVLTGDEGVDRVAFAGLRGLSDTLFFRTSVEPNEPKSVDLERDEIAFFPMLYWPVTANQETPSDAAYEKLNTYLRAGGLILFDTRDSNLARFGASSPEGRALKRLAAKLEIPDLEPLPDDHVLTRTFYLLKDFPGRHISRDVWVEAAPIGARQAEGMPFRNLNDGVTPVVIGGNDWASAWAIDQRGAPLVPIGRGLSGERQRELAFRFGVNLVMHVLTGNYKSDQVHVPALLDRLGQ